MKRTFSRTPTAQLERGLKAARTLGARNKTWRRTAERIQEELNQRVQNRK